MSGCHFASNVGAVILAAGTSSRMEEIKQLLPWKNTTLIGHVIEKLKSSNAKQVYLVLGAYHDKILNEINTDGVTVIINEILHYLSREQRLRNVRQIEHGEWQIGDFFPGAHLRGMC